MAGKKKKDQFVIACLDREADAATVLPLATRCAERLGKGLIVLNVAADGQSDWLKQYGLPYVGLRGDWKTAIDGLPTAFGGVLAVAAADTHAPRSSLANPATMLRSFRDCKTAFMAAPGPPPTANGQSTADKGPWPTGTILTLDHRRESKEKLIWASYMARFFGSSLTVATPAYRDAAFSERLRNNMVFTKKMFDSLGVGYRTVELPDPGFRSPDLQLMHGGMLSAETLLIAMTTDLRDRDLGDLVAGPAERRLLHASPCPILFLNHRDDIYVLCD